MDPSTKLIMDMTEQELRAVLLQLAGRHREEVVSEIISVLDLTRAPAQSAADWPALASIEDYGRAAPGIPRAESE